MSEGASIVAVRMDWAHTAIPQPGIRNFWTLHIEPEPAHPTGRKGLALSEAWRRLGSVTPCIGMLTLDGDVAVDPGDVEAMFWAATSDPLAVWTAPVKLWPLSTKRPGWTWGHWRGEPSQDDIDDPEWFTLCLTFLPRALMEACVKGGMRGWCYPDVDRSIARKAAQMGIPVKVARGAQPKHLNY